MLLEYESLHFQNGKLIELAFILLIPGFQLRNNRGRLELDLCNQVPKSTGRHVISGCDEKSSQEPSNRDTELYGG